MNNNIMKNYLFYYPFGAYGATFEQGKGQDLKEALKDARDNYFHGLGGANPSREELNHFMKEAVPVCSVEGGIKEIYHDSIGKF
jgi:hypothetical protein